MKVLNIHERRLPAPREKAGALLDSLASDRDALWPSPSWPPMRLDRPLGVGAAGGHGPIRYVVERYDPGRGIEFRFTGPEGFEGSHRFEVEPASDGACVLRHTIDMTARGAARLSWPLVFRPLHDALLEDALDKAEASLGVQPAARTWSPWVRFLRWILARRRRRAG